MGRGKGGIIFRGRMTGGGRQVWVNKGWVLREVLRFLAWLRECYVTSSDGGLGSRD